MKKIKTLGLIFITNPIVNLLFAQEKPNIVVIIADDLASNELSCYGGKNVKTPNIDRLAEEGVRFTNNYASCAMSVPIRASMYTGLYPARHGSYQNHKQSFSDIKSITHYLPETGYRVGRTGKRHTEPREVYQFEEVPGFEENCVSPAANFNTNGIKDYILKNEQPFCLFVCSTHPHVPWTWGNPEKINPEKIILPPNSVDNTETRELYRNFLAEIEALDVEVGAVVSTLKEAGKLDNTLIIFLGEQGPQFPGGKWTCWNYGQSSALIARYPKQIKAKSTSQAITQYEDILPTLVEFANGPAIEGIDGKSFLSALFGKHKGHRKYAYGIHNNIPEGPAYPIRSIRDERYKLIINLAPENKYHEKHMMDIKNRKQVWASWLESAETDSKAKWLVNRFVERPAIEFYDLKKDPWELNNLAGNKKHQKRIDNMLIELKKWMKQQGDNGAEMDVPF
ncbi:MAG: sulfatase [Dysgonomonas sp.]